MKTPDPIMEPATSMVESISPSPRMNLVSLVSPGCDMRVGPHPPVKPARITPLRRMVQCEEAPINVSLCETWHQHLPNYGRRSESDGYRRKRLSARTTSKQEAF